VLGIFVKRLNAQGFPLSAILIASMFATFSSVVSNGKVLKLVLNAENFHVHYSCNSVITQSGCITCQ